MDGNVMVQYMTMNAEQAARLKERAQQNYTLVNSANTTRRQDWLKSLYEGERFVEDRQLTTSQLNKLKQAGMPTFTINRMTAVIEVMKYFITANKPRWTASGYTTDDAEMAHIHNSLLEYCFDISDGVLQMGGIVGDTLNKSLGYFHIYIDPDADRGMGEAMFGSIPPDIVYVDPVVRDLMFRDSSFIAIAKNASVNWIVQKLPGYEADIRGAAGSPFSHYTGDDENNPSRDDEISMDSINRFTGEAETVLPFIELYRKRKVRFYNLFLYKEVPYEERMMMAQEANVKIAEAQREMEVSLEEAKADFQSRVEGGEMLPSRAQLELDKKVRKDGQMLQNMIRQAKQEVENTTTKIVNEQIRVKEYNKLVNGGIIDQAQVLDMVEFWEDRVFKEVSVGQDTFLYEEDTDFKEYPIIPLPWLFNGKPYPVSVASMLTGKQKEINKAHQIMVHHATLSSNAPWLTQSGVIINKKTWSENASMPSGILEYEYGGAESKPERQLPLPLNSAFFQIAQEGKSDLEYIAGIDSSLMGVSREQPDTFRGMMANDEFGTRRLRSWIKNVFEPVLQHVGEVFLDVAQHVYTAHKVFRLVDESGYKEYELNVPMYNDYGEIIGKMFDYSTLTFDVRIVAGSTLPTNPEAEVARWVELQEKGVTDDVETIKHIPMISDKEGLIKRKSLYSQLTSQNEQLSSENKDLDGQIQRLKNELIQSEVKNDVMRGGLESRKDVLETEAMQKTMRGKMQNEMVRTINDFKAELKDILSDIKNEKTKAQSQGK